MRVIKAKLADEPKRCVCEECGAELEYEPNDVHIGWMGCEYVTCPECGEESMVGDERKVRPTYPMTFSHTCKENGYVGVSEDTINEMIDDIMTSLRESDEAYDCAMSARGEVAVFGWKTSDGIDIYVTKDYWEDTIFQ